MQDEKGEGMGDSVLGAEREGEMREKIGRIVV